MTSDLRVQRTDSVHFGLSTHKYFMQITAENIGFSIMLYFTTSQIIICRYFNTFKGKLRTFIFHQINRKNINEWL